jgi:hypothetical protein
MKKGIFFSFEGIDGSGKSTQATILYKRLKDENIPVVFTREPGGTELGELVRTLVLEGPDMTAWPEALLYAAARAQLVAEVVRPALARGAVVISDEAGRERERYKLTYGATLLMKEGDAVIIGTGAARAETKAAAPRFGF